MHNMAYCRFQNTAEQFDEALATLDDLAGSADELPYDELRALIRLAASVKKFDRVMMRITSGGIYRHEQIANSMQGQILK